jgi:hypothetical protein
MPVAAIGAGASLLGGLLGSNASNQASQAQQQAAQQAADFAKSQGQASNNYQSGVTSQQNSLLNPFASAGQGATSQLSQLLQPGGQLAQGYQGFTAPTGVTEQNDPGYQFRLSQGLNALQNSAAARGGLLSSGTAKNINDYAQNSASNEYGNVYNRALGTYQTNQQNFNTNNNNLYGRLSGLAGQGLSAAGSLGGLLQSGANNTSAINSNVSGQVGQDLTNAGAARASGYVGGANAWGSALGGVANSLGGYLAGRNKGNGNASSVQQGGSFDPYSNLAMGNY